MSNEVRFMRLQCIRNEDWTGSDNVYLRYNGEELLAGTTMNQGDSVRINKFMPISKYATVDLFEEDWADPDDFLGRIVITEKELNGGLRSKDFRGDDAYYTLFYKVSPAED